MGRFRLCLDPGHGMSNVRKGVYDPGAVSGGMAEADMALLWALTIKHVAINEFGVEPSDIFLTRDDKSDVTPVWRRDDDAVKAGCTHFLSIHFNAASPLATGVETLIPAKALAMDNAWGALVQREAVRATGLRDRGVKSEAVTRHKRLAVFANAGQMKCCLLEGGFITSPIDRRKIGSRDVRLAFARGLMRKMTGRVG